MAISLFHRIRMLRSTLMVCRAYESCPDGAQRRNLVELMCQKAPNKNKYDDAPSQPIWTHLLLRAWMIHRFKLHGFAAAKPFWQAVLATWIRDLRTRAPFLDYGVAFGGAGLLLDFLAGPPRTENQLKNYTWICSRSHYLFWDALTI